MEVFALGPVRATVAGQAVPLGPRRQRLVLGLLALEAGRTVGVERLVDLLWPASPPRTARHSVAVFVSGLRTALTAAGQPDIARVLAAQGSGYVLRLDPLAIDAHKFRALLAQAQEVGDDLRRVALLSDALALWSGPLLEDAISIQAAPLLGAPWEEARLQAVELRLEALLRLGRPRDVLGELTDLVERHPLRERVAGLHMLALHQDGRTGEAIASFGRTRRLLSEQLGIDPGVSLRGLHLAILRDDPALRPAASPPPPASPQENTGPAAIPCQLPPAVPGFTGRADSFASLDETAAGITPGGVASLTVVISGPAGVGKTALAVHWARAHRALFPDGQLYANLGTHRAGAALPAEQVAGRFLRALGVPPGSVPADAAEAAAMLRTMLGDRRVLILLDDVAAADQVRILLTGAPGCMTLVTSRGKLPGLAAHDGARQLELGLLSPGEARGLLAAQLGADRVAAEPQAAAELATLCGYLPLALRIAAAGLAGRSWQSLADLAGELRGDSRLELLGIDDDEQATLRTAFAPSYTRLKPGQRLVFRMCGLFPGDDVTVLSIAALAAIPPDQARSALRVLTDAHLVAEDAPGRYRPHDLLRLYAAELAHSEEQASWRAGALARLYWYYLRSAVSAADVLYPQMQRLPGNEAGYPDVEHLTFEDAPAALAWLTAERANLVAAARRAASQDGARRYAWLIADATRGYFWMSRHGNEWEAIGQAALAAADADGTDDGAGGRAAAYLSLGQADRARMRLDRSVERFTQAVAAARATGWSEGEAAALGSMANTYRDQGRLAEAARYHDQAGALYARAGRIGGQAAALVNRGNVLNESGRYQEAAASFEASLALYQRLDARNAQAHVLHSLGFLAHKTGDTRAGLVHLDRALALHRESGSREGEADTLNVIASIRCDLGEYTDSEMLAAEAADLARAAADPRIEADATITLATLRQRRGDFTSALSLHLRALGLARASGYRLGELPALLGTSAARLGLGDARAAAADARECLRDAQRSGYFEMEVRALLASSAADLRLGEQAAALANATQALRMCVAAGWPAGSALSRLAVGRAQGYPPTG